MSTILSLFLVLATRPGGISPSASGTAIMVAGQPVEVGRAVVLWNDPKGFNGYDKRCIDQTGGCCDQDWPRYGTRKGLAERSLPALQAVVSQLVIHFDGCVNSRSCFRSMHNRPRPGGGCGLSAHFMIDTDGTIYQTLDLAERAFHAEQANSISVGVEMCNRGRYDPGEMGRLPAEYRTRPHRPVTINGSTFDAYDFRPEQYDSLISLCRALLRTFPKIQPVIPERDGQPLLETLEQPSEFHGIVGHLHVDLQKQKWDPGALDWTRLTRALHGLFFPVQVRAFSQLPNTREDLLAARRAASFVTEERVTGFFPMAPGRLWHSGVHLRGLPGSPVVAPARGRLLAARQAAQGRSFVLLRHEFDVEGQEVVFYSLLFHLELPVVSPHNPVPWMRVLLSQDRVAQRSSLAAGQVVLLDERVEAGDMLGLVDHVRRGPEQGPEVHFEIFTVDRPGGAFERGFQYLNAAADGPIVRRGGLMALADGNGDGQVTAAELRHVFRDGPREPRQALRRLVIRHRHEWGSRTSLDEFVALRELSGIPLADRRRLYATAIEPYIFWTDALASHAKLPVDQIVYSYHPIAFLLTLAAHTSRVVLPWPRDHVSGSGLEPRPLAHGAVEDWTHPAPPAIQVLVLPPLVGVDLLPKAKEQIPLLDLPPTDQK